MMGDDQYLFSARQTFNTPELFRTWLEEVLKSSFHDFAVIKMDSDEIIGFLHNYQFSLKDGHCKLAECVKRNYRGSGLGAMAALIFMHQLFEMYPLRKMYLTVYDYNLESLRNNVRAGFCEEGKIRSYKYYNGQYYDMHYYSIYREKFYEIYSGVFHEVS